MTTIRTVNWFLVLWLSTCCNTMKPKNPFISMLSRSIRRSTLSNFSVTARSFAKDVKPKKKVVKASAPPVTPTPIEQPAKVVRERKEKPKFDYVGADAVTWYNEFHRKASKKVILLILFPYDA